MLETFAWSCIMYTDFGKDEDLLNFLSGDLKF